jgi:ribosomal protein L40E
MKRVICVTILFLLFVSGSPHIRAEGSTKCVSGEDVEISNSQLVLSVFDDTGNINLKTPDGTLLLYQADTSRISFQVDGVTQKSHVGLDSYVMRPPTVVSPDSIVVDWEISGVSLEITYRLAADYLEVTAVMKNGDTNTHQAGIRFLLDTKLGPDDGAPLYAPSIGVETYETDIENPTFDYWTAYDFYPNPTFQTYGSLVDTPDRIVFAWWPNAVKSTWDYSPDPNQRFYTPGYTSTPESDSCVLLYYNPLTLAPQQSRQVKFFYGLSSVSSWNQRIISQLNALSALLDQAYTNGLNAIVDDVMLFVFNSKLVDDVLVPATDILKHYDDFVTDVGAVVGAADISVGLAKLVAMNAISFMPVSELILAMARNDGVLPSILSVVYDQLSTDLSSIMPTLSGSQALAKMAARQSLMSTFVNHVVVLSKSGNQFTRQSILDLINQDLGTTEIHQQIAASLEQSVRTVSAASIPSEKGQFVTKYLDQIMSELRQINEGNRQVLIVDQYFVNMPLLVGGSRVLAAMIAKFVVNSLFSVSYKAVGTSASLAGAAVTTVGICADLSIIALPAGVPVTLIGGVLSIGGAVLTLIGDWKETVSTKDLEAISTFFYTQLAQFSFIENALPRMGEIIASLADNTLAGQAPTLSSEYISKIEPSNGQNGVPSFDVTVTNMGSGDASGFLAFQVYTSRGAKIAAVPSYLKYTVLSGGSIKTTVPVPSFDSGIFGGVYILRVEMWSGPTLKPDIYWTTYNVGLLGDVSDFGSRVTSTLSSATQAVDTVLQGAITQGQRIVSNFVSIARAIWCMFMLNFLGSEVDLHITDSQGRHVGINYQTGAIELQIPRAQYSGSQTMPQWISVPPGEYTVEAVGFSVENSENFTVTAIQTLESPSILRAYPASFNEAILSGETLQLLMSISETGGEHPLTNVRIAPGNLGGNGGSINGPSSPVIFNVSQAESIAQTINYSIPLDARGIYDGAIDINAQGIAPNSSIFDIHTTIPLSLNVTTTDHSPPTTTCSPGPGSYREVTVSLSAADNESGVDNTYYRDNGGNWTEYINPFNLTEIGEYQIDYYSIDKAGNNETTKSVKYTIMPPENLWLWFVVAGFSSASIIVGSLYLNVRRKLERASIRQSIAKSLTCAKCHAENSSSAKFCRRCGERL